MALLRVTALATTDDDIAAISAVAVEPQFAGHVVVCDVDEDALAALQQRGVLIESVGEPPPSQPGDLAPALSPAMLTFGAAIGAASALKVLTAEPEAEGTDVYVISLAGPVLPAWHDELTAAGAHLLERLSANEYSVRANLASVPAIRALGFVQGLRLFTGLDTVDERELTSSPAPPAARAESVTYDAYLHPGADPRVVEGDLTRHGVLITGTGRRKVRFEALRGAAVLAEVARHRDVAAIEEFVPPRLANDRARTLLGVDGTRAGKGQLVAIADTGLDAAHPDFHGRVVKLIARGRPGDPSDPVGHGTHVAGSVMGNGTASSGAIQGVAPQANLIFQSVLDAKGELGGLGVDLGDLFDEAYGLGARIHSNSWGALAASAYRINSLEVDAYVHEHPDMLVVMAAGNSGTAAGAATPGFVGLLSVDAPGTAKNALTVGASRSDRHIDGDPTFGQWWPKDFPDDPIAAQHLAGDASALAAFSGRGPCDEQIRLKPDVVAPGTFILSARSSIAPTTEFWAEYSANNYYAFMGGTSMATPLVAGCAALVREYYAEERAHQPSAALLKATLINGTRWLSAADAVADHPGEPNYHQGFGCVYLPTTIPAATEPAFRLEFADSAGDTLTQTGSGATYVVNADAGSLRMCLAWTDPPGRGLQNTVTLIAEHPQSATRWVGNPHRPQGVTAWDAGNNVQVIRLPQAAAGAYRISIVAVNLLVSPQPYALVVTGPLTSALTRV
jgi:serine protease AprX